MIVNKKYVQKKTKENRIDKWQNVNENGKRE